MLDGKVIPLLFGLELSDLVGPLSQFQAQKVSEMGIMEVVKSINKVAEKPASLPIVEQLVPTLWPRLQEALSKIPDKAPSEKHKRQTHEVLEELVTGVRGLSTRMNEAGLEFSDRERFSKRRRMKFHPGMFEEFFMVAEGDETPIGLLLMAGFFREDYPWLAEILTETYRETKNGSGDDIDLSLSRLRRTVSSLMHHPLTRDLSGSKESMMFAEELPMILDMTLSRYANRKQPRRSKKLEEREP